MIEFSQELNIPLIATNDIHYLHKEDAEAQDILLCLQNKKKVEDENRMNMMGTDFSMRPNEEMIAAFKDVPEAIANTLKIAEMCNVEIPLGQIQLPYFPVPSGFDEIGYLEHWAREGLKKRYGKSYEEIDKIKKDLINTNNFINQIKKDLNKINQKKKNNNDIDSIKASINQLNDKINGFEIKINNIKIDDKINNKN